MTSHQLVQEIFDIISPFLKAAVALGVTWCTFKGYQLMNSMRASSARDDLEKQAPSSVARVYNESVKGLKATGLLTPEKAAEARDAAVKYIRDALPEQAKLLEKNGIPVAAMLEQFVEKAVVELETLTHPPSPAPVSQSIPPVLESPSVDSTAPNKPVVEPK